ncbi:hypothetical protein [Natronospora cellulosivora (SeqCode)]
MIFAIVILIIISYFVFVDAKKRGMKAGFWSGFTIFILILALPIYFIVRKPKISGTEKSVET